MADKRDIEMVQTRRTRPAPERFANLLELVNDLPKKAKHTLDIRAEVENFLERGVGGDRLRGLWGETAAAYALALRARRAYMDYGEIQKVCDMVFVASVASASPRLREFIGPLKAREPNAVFRAQRKYDGLINARIFLRRLAKTNGQIIEELGSHDAEAMLAAWRRQGFEVMFDTLETLIDLEVDTSCRVGWRPVFWIEALGDGVEVVRIRQCPICDKLFWAGRMQKSACSGACSQVWRKRLSRLAERAAQREFGGYRKFRKQRERKKAVRRTKR